MLPFFIEQTETLFAKRLNTFQINKMNTLKKLQQYAGNRKIFFPLSMMLSAISALAGMIPYILIWYIIQELLTSNEKHTSTSITYYAWWAVGIAVVGVVFYFGALLTSHLAAFRVEANIRREAMSKIVKMPLGFFDHNTSGKIRKIIDDNAGITHNFLAHQLPDLASTMIMPIVALFLIFIFNWQLGLACMIPIIISFLILSFSMHGRSEDFMHKYMTSLEDMNTEAIEYVRGIPIVKVFQQTIFSFKNFHKSIVNYNKMVTEYSKVWMIPMSVYRVIINAFVFVLAPVSILLIGNTDNYTSVILNFFLFVLITPIFSQSIMKSMHLQEAIQQANEAVNRLEKLTQHKPFSAPQTEHKISDYDVRFENVEFAYPESKDNVVDGIDFTIHQGETVALVGPSGSGKTTIARLLPRFWDVMKGSISIGGINVKSIAQDELMSNISFVFQNTKLFKTTLLENIKYGNANASLDEVNRVIDLAQCREIINKQPKGLYTKIGTEGTYLSGGEQQRIVLARAILKNAPIVVLDEATAFADPENEHLIQEALKVLTKGKTVLMIAHRLTSIVNANNILVINKGKIMEQGTHNKLLQIKGIYSNMWNEYQKSVQWTIGKEDKNA